MKRYTLKFQPISPSISATDLREEVDRVLLRLHPRITYRMGQVHQDGDGNYQAQILMDGKRSLLDTALKAKQWDLPVQFEGLSWGWSIENEDAALPASALTSTNVDPLARVQAFDGLSEFPLSKRRLWLRFLSMIVLTLVLLALLMANVFNKNTPVLEGIYIVCFAAWLISLNETPLDLRVYAHRIAFVQTGLDVSYWYRKKPIYVGWQEIWGLDYANSVCTIHKNGGKLRCIVSERFGCTENKLIVKTIISKAELLYVEGNSMVQKYRKADAGISHPV